MVIYGERGCIEKIVFLREKITGCSPADGGTLRSELRGRLN